MKLDKRLEFITAMALIAFDSAEDDSEEINLCRTIIKDFELNDESFPNIDNTSVLLLLRAIIFEIQDMIDEYNRFEREEVTLH